MTYVWEMTLGGHRPTFKRYTLVKKMPGGGVTVEFRPGCERLIRPASGRRFFFDFGELKVFYRQWLEDQLETRRRQAQDLEKELAMPDLGVSPVGHHCDLDEEFYQKTKGMKPDDPLPSKRR